MRINSLEITNVRSLAEWNQTFPDGLIAICGSNGSGKSTILTSILVAIWGARNLTALVKSGETNMRIRLSVSFGEDEYVITRSAHVRPSGITSQLQLLQE